MHLAVHDACEHLGPRDGELVALAPQVLDENGEVQLAAAGDAQHIGLPGILDPQRHVALQLTVEPLAQLAAGDEFALAPG